MPRLTKGGNYVFGWSLVNSVGRITVPAEAEKHPELELFGRPQ